MSATQQLRRIWGHWLTRNKAAVAAVLAFCTLIATTAQADTLDRNLTGAWEQRGYGRVLDITADRLTTYDVTSVSCSRMSIQPLAAANQKYDRVGRGQDHFSMFEVGGITRYDFRRLRQLPTQCRQLPATAVPVDDPKANFAVLWHAFQEHYAFFQPRGINWSDMRTRFAPRIDAVASEADLYAVFTDLLGTLGDQHVVLRAGKREFTSGTDGEFQELWKATTGTQAGDAYEARIRKHVNEEILHGKFRQGANDTMTWGWAAPDVGYINTTAMELSPRNGPTLTLPEQLELVDRTMAEILKELGGAKALIVDARFNDGGYDAVALRIMGAFTRERRLAFTKKAVEQDGYTPAQPIYFEPSAAAQFTGPIYYLQSGTTVSAAEIFTLAMMVLPNVTRVGTSTCGVLSDELAKQLPNGWNVTLSNEVYLASDGALYERRGIPPQIPIAAAGVRDLGRRLQLDIEAALSLVRWRNESTQRE